MFSTSDIVANTNSKSFQRGSTLFEKEDSVADRNYIEGKKINELTACVRSQSGIAERFDTSIVLDGDCECILDYSCDCPAARKYGVMCKHCVATALAFRKDPSSFDGYAASLVPHSSASIISFLDDSTDTKGRTMEAGSVHIALELTHAFGNWTAQFSLEARDMTYVMSDIGAFIRALECARYFSYGKMLGFIHTFDALDATSQNLALVMGDIVAHVSDSREMRSWASVAAPTKTRTPKRTLELTEQDVVLLINAIGTDAFKFTDADRSDEACTMHAVEGNPDMEMRIIEVAPDTYEIVRDESFQVAIGCNHACVFMDGTVYKCTQEFTQAAWFLHDVYLSADDELIVAGDDVASFCKSALPMLESSMRVASPPALEVLRPREARFIFYLDRAGIGHEDAIECELRVDYGGIEHVLLAPATASPTKNASAKIATNAAALENDATSRTTGFAEDKPTEGESTKDDASSKSEETQTYRDEEAEARIIETVSQYFDITMRLPLDEIDRAGTFLYEGIKLFQELGDVFTTPEFDRLTSQTGMRVQIGLSIAGDLINLDIKSTDVSKDELAQILSAYQRKKHFHKLKNGAIASLENLEVVELDRMMQDLGLKPGDLAKDSIEIPTYNAFFLDREYAEAERDESFESYIWRFDSDSDFNAEPPHAVKDLLRPYQLDGFRWLTKLSSMGFGGILADEMGLGKSLQMIAFLQSEKDAGRLDMPALIVCPASLVYNWSEEFKKFAPEMKVCPVDGPPLERAQKRAMQDVDVFIASYDSIRQDSEAYQACEYSIAVLDEAQFIKNHATKTTRAVKRLHARRRFALTGTPVENRLSEIWSIMDFLMPGFLGTYALFRRRYESDILGGDKRAAQRLQSLVGPFVLRRLKSEVLSDLPDKQESIVRVPLEDEQKRLYDAIEQKLRDNLLAQKKSRSRKRASRASNKPMAETGLRVDVLSELMRLRQTALDPSLAYSGYRGNAAKTGAILELVGEAMESGKKALIFSQFTSYLDILKVELEKRDIRYYEITGQTSKKERVEMAADFNKDDVPVFLVSLKAGGTGLNLIGAQVVIHADPWWNAAAVNQATDRAHRIGQTGMVSVYKVIAKDTIEERILALQQKKEKLAESVVGETSIATLQTLTRAELESLLLDD